MQKIVKYVFLAAFLTIFVLDIPDLTKDCSPFLQPTFLHWIQDVLSVYFAEGTFVIGILFVALGIVRFSLRHKVPSYVESSKTLLTWGFLLLAATVMLMVLNSLCMTM